MLLLAEPGDVAGCEAENTMMCHQLVAVAASVFQSSLQCQRAQQRRARGREGILNLWAGPALPYVGWLIDEKCDVGNFLISLSEQKELNF